MKQKLLIFSTLLFLGSCDNKSNQGSGSNQRANVDIANGFIDAFYSFNSEKLKSNLNEAAESQPLILYYQKWAECGSYKIIDRHKCIVENDSVVVCPVTVKDDLIGALGIGFYVTDSFRLKIINGKIRSVQTSSNDPEMYHQATEWVKQFRPELIEEPCIGIWEGGPTPCECVKAMVKGFKEFRDSIN